jgi:polyhydroxybutyrate depolymerase
MRAMIRALPAIALVFMLLVAACTSDGDGDPAPPASSSSASPSPTASPAACTPARTHVAGATPGTLMSDGLERAYTLHVPDGYSGDRATGLIFVLHPSNGAAMSMSELTAFERSAGERGFITVFPEATGTPQSWNADGFTAGVKDSMFLRDLLAALSASLCIDAQRVYVTGFSNGGAMALRAACDLEGVFAAVAPVAAPYPMCQAAVPIVAFHGNADAAVPYEGGVTGDGVSRAPVHKSVSAWAGAIGCDALPVIARAAADVELATYARCPLGDSEALLYTVLNGGHTWPGAAIDYPVEEAGVTTHAISANELILDFFESHPRP